MTRRLLRLALLAACACRAFAAEPVVDSSQLPRIPPTPPEKALATFKVKPGFRLELVAAEPLVVSPVAMSFDEDGRLYVVEMRDYSERRPERLGRVRLLEDTDGDGRFDKSTVFTDGLPWPTAVTCWAGGVFVGTTPDIIYFKDTDGDGKADVRETIFTGFASDYAPFATNKLNVQALMNSFQWSLDNRIHGATSFSGGKVKLVDSPFVQAWLKRTSASRFPEEEGRSEGEQKPPRSANSPLELRGRDFSFDPRTLSMRPESGGGQHGMSFDNRGRKFVCSNSDHIQQIVYEDRYAARNPHYTMPSPRVSIAADGPAAEVFRISPDEPWRVLRTQWRVAGKVPGPIEGGGRASGYFTGATGVTIYRGDAYGEDFVGDAFIGDAGGNLVHRKKIRPDGILMRAERPADEQRVEFLASTDNWFRPVQFANAPDGCLYIADMYREVIEHPWSLPPNLKQHLDLNSGSDRGRIYRIVPTPLPQPSPPRLGKASTTELAKLFEHPNGWHRDTAARLLYERQDRSATNQMRQLARQGSTLARIHALHGLVSLGGLERDDTRDRGFPMETIHAIRVAEEASLFSNPDRSLQNRFEGLVQSSSKEVLFQFALSLGTLDSETRISWLASLARRAGGDPWMRAAIVNAAGDQSSELFMGLARSLGGDVSWGDGPWFVLADLAQIVGATTLAPELRQAASEITRLKKHQLGLEVAARFLKGLRDSRRSFQGEKLTDPVKSWFEDAARDVTAAYRSEEFRVRSIRLVGLSGSNAPPEVLYTLLNVSQTPAVRAAALGEIDRFGGTGPAEELLARWPSFSPVLHNAVIEVLLKRPERNRLLLDAVEKGTVQVRDIPIVQQAQLRSHPNAAIRAQAGKAFGRAALAARESVIETFQAALGLKGDAKGGRRFFQVRCASCHRLGSEGHALGPDLATVKSGGKEKLLIAILDPNREVAPNFASYSVETKDGESLAGILTSESANSVTLRMAGGTESVIARANIASLQSQGRSLMPEGLEEGLKAQDIADLLEFILAP